MTPQDFVDMLRRHERFLRRQSGGRRAVLTNIDLSGLRLSNMNLREAKLTGVSFRKCRLVNADFSFADLFAADFAEAELTGANMKRADLRGARLCGAVLRDANLKEADLRPGALVVDQYQPREGGSVDFSVERPTEGNGRITDLTGADMRRSNLEAAKLQDAKLVGVDLQRANLSFARLERTNLRGAILADVRLTSADFAGASVSVASTLWPLDLQLTMRTHAIWADSDGRAGRRAELGRGDMRDMDLSHAFLSGANLAGANLSGANLTSAELVLTNLEGANLDGAYLSRTDLSGANLTGASLKGAVITSVKLEPVVVKRRDDGPGNKLVQTNFTDADLTGAEIAYTSFHKSLLGGMKPVGVIAAINNRLEVLQTI